MRATRTDQDQEWRRTKLSLERPYKDDEGNLIPALLDITLDGQFVYEPREEPDAKIGEHFSRIFLERGLDFFDLDAASRYKSQDDNGGSSGDEGEHQNETEEAAKKEVEESRPMSPEELFKMRAELIDRLR